MTSTVADRIEKSVVLHAPRARVWRAITDSTEFGRWFGIKVEGVFRAGTLVRARLVGTEVDAEVAKAQQAHGDITFEIAVDRIEPERLFAFRWHPYAIEAGVDFSSEPTTLVTFTLEEVTNGVKVTVVESGFDQIPLARRAQAFASNDQGWTIQVMLVEKYLAQNA
jgi:uncharacterized protein YndB with AHSA1/START domain